MTALERLVQRQRLVALVAAEDDALMLAIHRLGAATQAQWASVRANASASKQVRKHPILLVACAFLVGTWLGYRRISKPQQ
jgi:hypothetical protein